MEKLRWGIIGLGAVAYEFAKGFKNSDYAELLGIASKDKNKINKFKEDFVINKNYCFDNYEKLIENNDVDIIYIALPNAMHYEWIIKCLKKRKKVLVEKPATMNSEQIKDIKKNFARENFFLTEGFMYLYHPQIKKVLELINQGIIGKLISMESSFGKNLLTKKNIFGFKKKKIINIKNRLFNKELGGGVILDLGCYPVSFSTLIASQELKINYNEVKVINKKVEIGDTGVDIHASTELYFENNFTSKISSSFKKDLGRKSKIIGTNGELTIEDTWLADPPKVYISQNTKREIQITANKNIYSYEINSISQLLLRSKNEMSFQGLTIDDTIGNMQILDKWKN